jgi:Ala-tRNA(Pro) deacylase
MMPWPVEEHLRNQYHKYEHHTHASAPTAQDLAAAAHVTGYVVAKLVVLTVGGELALAVVAATDRVNLALLEEATGSEVELVPEAAFAEVFRPCAAGAEPPFSMFGVPIFVDDKLVQQPRILVPAGTHEDAVMLDTGEWLATEKAQPIANLGRRALHVVAC